MSDVEHPIARGRKPRVSREELNPKIARSPLVRSGQPRQQGFGPVAEEEVASNDLLPSVNDAGDQQSRDDEVVIHRASTAAARKGIIPDDSADAPAHPIARGRKVRPSREEMPRNFRPPATTGIMDRLRRRFSKEKPSDVKADSEPPSEALATVEETPTAGAA